MASRAHINNHHDGIIFKKKNNNKYVYNAHRWNAINNIKNCPSVGSQTKEMCDVYDEKKSIYEPHFLFRQFDCTIFILCVVCCVYKQKCFANQNKPGPGELSHYSVTLRSENATSSVGNINEFKLTKLVEMYVYICHSAAFRDSAEFRWCGCFWSTCLNRNEQL